MAESSLSLGYADYLWRVGDFLGWGRGAALGDTPYTTTQQAKLDDCVASGIRQFYFPPPAAPNESPYDWSFLHPVTTMTLQSGTQGFQLPDDFGGFEGVLTCLSGVSTTVPWPIRLHNESAIREAFAAATTATGPPVMCALNVLKGTTNNAGQRQQLLFYPLADQTYQVQFQYYVLPDYLSGSMPYVYGGAAHVETILESCLAIAEQRIDDMGGVHTEKFAQRLMASIGMDKKNKAEVFGYNGDRSDSKRYGFGKRAFMSFPLYTYNGSPFQ
jgi:hypothetical protein